MHTIFVTGAEGYAGNLFVQRMRERGYTVVAGVRNRARKLLHERQFGKAIVCDVSDAINVARAVASAAPDAVVHLAATSHAWSAAEQPLLAYQSLVTAWANVLDAVRRACPRARVLLVSACDVYGKAAQSGQPLREDVTPQPVSTFGALKLAAESIAHTYFQKYHLNLSIARPFHYTGPGQPDSFYFGAAAQQLTNVGPTTGERELTLPDLSCRRDVLHVQDVLEAYERILNDGRPNETYNVCSGQTRTCREVVQAMAQAAQIAVRLADSQTPQDDENIQTLCGDNTKLRTELAWQPTHTVDAAIQELVHSYQRSTQRQPAAQTA